MVRAIEKANIVISQARAELDLRRWRVVADLMKKEKVSKIRLRAKTRVWSANASGNRLSSISPAMPVASVMKIC